MKVPNEIRRVVMADQFQFLKGNRELEEGSARFHIGLPPNDAMESFVISPSSMESHIKTCRAAAGYYGVVSCAESISTAKTFRQINVFGQELRD